MEKRFEHAKVETAGVLNIYTIITPGSAIGIPEEESLKFEGNEGQDKAIRLLEINGWELVTDVFIGATIEILRFKRPFVPPITESDPQTINPTDVPASC